MNKPSHEYCKECKDWNGIISNCMNICGIPMEIIDEWEKYHALGTVEELQKAKTQYENIASCAEKISMSGLCDYKMAHQNIVSSLKVMSDNTLEEYIRIGTIEELREAREKQRAKKPIIKPWSPALCPTCQCELSESLGDGYYKHLIGLEVCPKCFQRLDWSEE